MCECFMIEATCIRTHTNTVVLGPQNCSERQPAASSTEEHRAHTTARCTQKRPSSAPHPKSAPKPNGGGGE